MIITGEKVKQIKPLEIKLNKLRGRIQDDIMMDYKFKKPEEEIELKETYLEMVEDIINYCNTRNRF